MTLSVARNYLSDSSELAGVISGLRSSFPLTSAIIIFRKAAILTCHWSIAVGQKLDSSTKSGTLLTLSHCEIDKRSTSTRMECSLRFHGNRKTKNH